ncbi:preprotein translocase subunit SecE [bacterium (Candidatus Gribaldobacteria) CG_4_10_14_0_8_um_filter_33_9]|uniref:Preprotein translocase subunit SecE n=1 Tax=bacterium (Candidatus Gribaldobacteria) CG_4_10_14_0_8_um_filter_33_9 TaxID=2014266 RepID=A0A2M7RMH2_9BACT|nr:MAG: preprotein translocase subunit SecE [bacterium (Candidatus Gribaldobacteria) CG_4_10_14_0_8_um_filter_33_9]
MLEKIKTFLKEVGVQGKKIDWPRKKQAFNYTLIVIGISMGAALFLGALDFVFLKILGKFVF